MQKCYPLVAGSNRETEGVGHESVNWTNHRLADRRRLGRNSGGTPCDHEKKGWADGPTLSLA